MGRLPARRLVIPALCVLALAALDATARSVRRFSSDAKPQPLQLLADPLPLRPFAARDLDGRDVSPATWLGRVAVVNVWATWCGPCRQEIPALVALQAKYPDRLVVLGILDDAAPDDAVRAFASSLRINYPIVRTTWEIERSISPPPALPMTYLVDTAGRIVAVHIGLLDAVGLERAIERLIREG